MRRGRDTSWPAPTPEALAHSDRLTARIAERIGAAGGWISFADYMAMALYEPGLGYYAAGARKFGPEGDFVTAPELSPIFGQAVAAQVAQVLRSVGGGDILELGAGSGRLAVDILGELERLDCLPERYRILEVSPDLRQRQALLLRAELPHLFDRVVWLETVPNSFVGAIVGNEVLDALPVHLVRWQGGDLFERGVTWSDPEGFSWQDRPLTEGPLMEVARRLPIAGPDYLSEISLAAPALVRTLADCLTRGLILFFDYGFPQAEYYHPDRAAGTLMCHYRHRAFDDPFHLPGLTDITCHVDFTAVADAALEAGLEVMGYASQAHFLANAGALDQLARHDLGSVGYLKQASALQKLIQPSEMGELFKVIALGRAMPELPMAFLHGDRRHTL